MKLLLDSHVKKAVVSALRRRLPHVDVLHLADWCQGTLLHSEDGDILAVCYQEGRAWLTYDQQTVPDLLREWAAQERPHTGVFFGDKNTVPPNDVGAVAAAGARLVGEIGTGDTTNLIRFLRPRS